MSLCGLEFNYALSEWDLEKVATEQPAPPAPAKRLIFYASQFAIEDLTVVRMFYSQSCKNGILKASGGAPILSFLLIH